MRYLLPNVCFINDSLVIIKALIINKISINLAENIVQENMMSVHIGFESQMDVQLYCLNQLL